MINFKEELKKYEPILEISEVEESIRKSEVTDMFDLLRTIAKRQEDKKTEE